MPRSRHSDLVARPLRQTYHEKIKVKLNPSFGPSQPSTSQPSLKSFTREDANDSDQITASRSSSSACPSDGKRFTACQLIFMKIRAYDIIRRAGQDPNSPLDTSEKFQIAPEKTTAAANVSFFPDETLNRLMSKVLFLYPTITNIVSATAFVFWSETELRQHTVPMKRNSKHQNNKKKIIPNYKTFFDFWDTIFNISSEDRATKLENAIKNFRYALDKPEALNLAFFTNLLSPHPRVADGAVREKYHDILRLANQL